MVELAREKERERKKMREGEEPGESMSSRLFCFHSGFRGRAGIRPMLICGVGLKGY